MGTLLIALAAALSIGALVVRLGPGAIVSSGGVAYVVRGSVTYREGPVVWWERLPEGGDQPLWSCVDGARFRESERGRAGIHHRGHDGPARRTRHVSTGKSVLTGELTVHPARPPGAP